MTQIVPRPTDAQAAALDAPSASRPYGFLHALAGVPYPAGHEIRQLQPDRELCVRCERRPANPITGLYCASCHELLADFHDDASAEL